MVCRWAEVLGNGSSNRCRLLSKSSATGVQFCNLVLPVDAEPGSSETTPGSDLIWSRSDVHPDEMSGWKTQCQTLMEWRRVSTEAECGQMK